MAWKQIVEPAQPFLDAVDQRLDEQVLAFEPEIASYAKYALATRGKHLRPLLVCLSAEAAGRLTDEHLTLAVIIETVHLATLVHDDVLDEARLRRGRPTLAAKWGNEISVLLGDCLFAHALKLAAGFPTTEICRAVASATNTVCSGEILQTHRRGDFAISRAEYFKMLSMKTAALFALSCDLGAYLAAAAAVDRERLRQFGMALGTAYQVYDDCLDLFGLEAVAGKSLGNDLANGKVTLPVLMALERSEAKERNEFQEWMRDWKPAHLPLVLEWLVKHDALEGSRRVIHQYLATGGERISGLSVPEGTGGLGGLSEYLAQQTDALGVLY